MDKQKIMELMGGRGFTFNMEIRDGKGGTISYHFLSEPVYSKRHKDMLIIPPFECTVYPGSGEFQLFYAVPKNISKLETPKCGSFDNDGHFYKICNKFETAVQVLYEKFGDE